MLLKKIFKYTILTSGVLIGLTIISIIGLVTLVNPNKFKPLIITQVMQATGRTITLDGDISWKIYPNLGVTVRDVTLSNPPNQPQFANESTFLSVKSADIAVALIPLITKNIQLKTLDIQGLNIKLIQKNGINNWTFTPPQTTPITPSEEQQEAKPIKLSLDAFSLTNSTIKYDNYDSQQHINLINTNILIGTGFNGHIKLDQKAQLVDLKKVTLNYNNDLIGEINLNLTNFESPNFDTNFNLSKFNLNKIFDELAIANKSRQQLKLLDSIIVSGKIVGNTHDLNLQHVSFNLSDTIKGNVDINLKNVQDPTYNGNITLEPFNLNLALDQLNIANKERKDKPLLNQFAMTSDQFQGDLHHLNINKLNLTLGNQFNLIINKLKITNFIDPTISGSIEIPQTNLNKVLNELNIANAARINKNALDSFAFKADSFYITTTDVKLAKLKLKLGVLNLNANKLNVNNIKNPVYSGDFTIGELNLNQFLDSLAIANATRKDKPLLNKFVATSTSFNGTVDSISLNNLQLSFGDTIKPNFSRLTITNFSQPTFSGHINLANFSANKLMPLIGMETPNIENKAILNNISLDSNFAATTNSVKLTNLNANIDKTTTTGTLDIGSFNPLIINNNISINQLDVADFSNINGYKVPMKNLNFTGNIKMNEKMEIASLTGKQSIAIGNITVQGINTNGLITQFSTIINNAGKGNTNLITTAINATQTVDAINQMKKQIQNAIKPGVRDYSQTTSLGKFSAQATISNGVINPSTVSLTDGGIANISGSGSVNLAGNKNINYTTMSKITAKGINPVFDKLNFTTQISGTIDNPSASLNWLSIQEQLASYLFQQNKSQIQNVVKQQINNAVGQQINNTIGKQNGNQATDAISKGVTNAIGKLFGN